MSGRLHVFLYDGMRERLNEMARVLGIEPDPNALGHLLREGLHHIYDEWKANALQEQEIEQLKHVQEPTFRLERKVHVFMNEGTVKRLDAMEAALEIDHFDTAHSHLLQLGFNKLYTAWNASKIPEAKLAEIKTVFKPKVVYHN